MTQVIKLIKSTFYREAETKRRLARFIMQATQLSFGPECRRFEQSFARYHGRRHAVMFNSGSSANLALIRSLIHLKKLPPRALIGFSAITWSTNVMPLTQSGMRVFPVDVELDTLNVSSRTLERALDAVREKPTALFLTNALGLCDDIDVITRTCRRRGILLIEDNCESLGSRYRGKFLGNFGYASTQSFYVGHIMSTVEGGMVLTDDAKLADMLRIVRAHGWDRNLPERSQADIRHRHRITSPFYAKYVFYHDAYNLRPSELNGFIGNHQLPYLDEIIRKRESNYLRVAQSIGHDDRYHHIRFGHMDRFSSFGIPIVCRTQDQRDKLVRICDGRIEVRPILAGDITKHPYYRRLDRRSTLPVDIPNAHRLHCNGLYFGNNPELTRTELTTISDVLTHP